jgi:uncharacterized repeat protein (TIGR04138 family)
MQIGNFDEALDKIVAKDSRYNRDAYLFVREALDYTQKLMAKTTREKEARESRESAATSPTAAANAAGSETGEEKPNHVSGQELLGGIRALALEQFGPMALAVLQEWGIQRCEDFGEIVFNMVDNNLLAKTTEDSRDDFKGGYDFDQAFRQPFQPLSRKKSAEQPEPKSSKA